MARPISHKEFLPEYEMFKKNKLQFGKNIVLNRGVHPFKRKYLPFYEQMATQLTTLLKQYTRRSFVKHFEFYFRTKAYTRTGQPYINESICSNLVLLRRSTEYRGEFYKLHKDGFAYGSVSMYNNIGLSYSVDIWFRWKSNVPGYEYIEPDDELDLKAEDITFELCTQVPEEYILRFYAKSAEEYYLEEWKDVINNEHYYPIKRTRKKLDFPCEISENIRFPDLMFTLYLNCTVTDDIRENAISIFIAFQEDWDSKNLWGIHDIAIMDDEPEQDNVLKIVVDFGSSSYKIINALVKWLRYSNLDIKKVVIQ